MKDQKFYVVLADYSDSWDLSDNELPWSIVKSHPKIISAPGFEDKAVYLDKNSAMRRADCVTDHATKIEILNQEQIVNF